MATVLKVIKTKQFEARGEKHTHYTAAYKGRLFGLSTLRFEADDFEVSGDTLKLNCEVEVLKHTSTDGITGETKSYLDLVPKSGLVLADF